MTNTTSRKEHFVGSDLSGADGDTSRYIVLSNSNIISSTLRVYVNGIYLHETNDYTLSSTTLTFINPIWDENIISVYYDTLNQTVPTSIESFGSTQELARFMGIEATVPSKKAVGSSRVPETVGTGDSSTTEFYLDYPNILAGTYALYHGSSLNTKTALTESTDYTLDKDSGTITLTATGLTTVGTDNIYAVYSYCDAEVTDTELQEALYRAVDDVESKTSTVYTNGSSATPDWGVATEEKHTGKGEIDRRYFTYKRPIADIFTNISEDITTASTSIDVDSTDGFPESGFLAIETDKATYTGKTDTSFTGVTGLASSHTTGKTATGYVIETSTSDSGSVPVWDVLEVDKDYDLDFKNGRVFLHESSIETSVDTITLADAPQPDVPNRFRISYLYGVDSIPHDLNRAVLMIASKDLMHSMVRRSTMKGLNSFRPEMIDVDEEFIKETLKRYAQIKATNV